MIPHFSSPLFFLLKAFLSWMFFLPTWVIFIIDFSRLSNFDYYCLGNEWGSFRTKHQGTVLRNSLTQEELGANQKTCKKIHISNYVGIWLRGRWLETGYKGRKKWSKCSFHHLIPWGLISLPGIFHSWEKGTGHNLWPQCSKNTRKEKHLSTHLAKLGNFMWKEGKNETIRRWVRMETHTT